MQMICVRKLKSCNEFCLQQNEFKYISKECIIVFHGQNSMNIHEIYQQLVLIFFLSKSFVWCNNNEFKNKEYDINEKGLRFQDML